MFNKKPTLVKDLPLNTIRAVVGCYSSIDDHTTVVDVLNAITEHCSLQINEIASLKENKEKFESALSDKYIKLERKLRNDLAEEESHMVKSFNLKEEKKEEEIFKLQTNIAELTQDLSLIKKENKILEAKMDNQDELIAEISQLETLVAALTAENNEKDSKFNLLLDIYENPKIQEVKIVEPKFVEPKIIQSTPTVIHNNK